MQVSTGGTHVRAQQLWLREAVELLSSMRFAISLLSIISIASVIGTVLKQNEPFTNYVNQFGPFWFEAFRVLGLYSVYNTPWFLLILAFLVLSTSLCLVRNAPKMIKDMRAWRDHVREDSLRNFGHKHEFASARPRAPLATDLQAMLNRRGFAVRQVEHTAANATLLTAKAGTWNRLGYILAHGAIVLICLGGLLDSELLIKAQVLFGGKTPVRGDMLIRDVPPAGRLSIANPTFRANILIPEGGSSRHAIINYRDSALVQELPFTIELKKFIVDYYSTGMPKLFASEVEVTDHEDGRSFMASIKVNEPLIYKGIAVYQSSFEDGGSKLVLKGWPMRGAANYDFPFNGEVGGTTSLGTDATARTSAYSVEFTGFRALNVENLAEAQNKGLQDAAETERKFRESVAAVLSSGSSATRGANTKDLRNVGPSVQYKLRDASGQAREFNNYMLPVELDGHKVFLAGMRENPNEEFRFLRIPADADGSLVEFMRLRAALFNPEHRAEAARRFALQALPEGSASDVTLRDQLTLSARRGLDIFAGAGSGPDATATPGGFAAVAAWLEKTVSKPEQEKAGAVVMKILGGSIWELWQVARESAGLKPVLADEANGQFAHLAINSLSDTFFYEAPVMLQLDSFTEVQASVFQLTRSPGKNVVYFGSLLLVLGIFAMFYIRERRIWIWLKDLPDGSGKMLMAMSSARQNLDFEQEFDQLGKDCAALGQAGPEKAGSTPRS